MERLPPKVEAARSSRVGCHRARWQVCQTRPSKQMSDLLATISKSTTRTSSICTNGSVCGISLFEGRRGYGGESVSQSPLKDQAFSTLLDQNPPFELRPKAGVSPPIFSRNPSWLIQVLAPSISVGGGQAGLVGACSPKAKVTRSNRLTASQVCPSHGEVALSLSLLPFD
jgi:hypothetical protein